MNEIMQSGITWNEMLVAYLIKEERIGAHP